MSHLLKIERLKKVVEQGGRPYLFAGVSSTVDERETIALLGASGQGKSTLLRILALLDRQDEGTLLLHSKPSGQWQPREWRMKVCYVSQQAVMLPGSVEDNLRTVSVLHRTAFDKPLARRLMDSLGLAHIHWNKSASGLSGGEKQRLALIRSLLLRPELFLLDEITASLDVHSKHAVEEVLSAWSRNEGAAMIWVTHDLEQARNQSGRVWFMGEGTLLEDCETERFFKHPSSIEARTFLQWSEAGEQPV
ncbi:ABC transporter ATP-binding protein [Paenibacillus beijingensis]|uniref:ABC transporter n=1 Tax=Paenibacillus beijingensis TaxID=1126833 RepID=A0A0D5NH77_9BACL|nr:ATP-binding cassette domain-containing protein [Paenibacillus beijingensis]AJY74734.1 ABC transporter [Paenibacillus beijingensis]